MQRSVLFGLVCLIAGLSACKRSQDDVRDTGASQVATANEVSPSSPGQIHPRARQARAAYFDALNALDTAMGRLEQAARDGAYDDAREAFRRARIAYKHVEALTEYYAPRTVRSMNGPVLDRAEPDEPATIIPATGFQVIEEALFPEPATDWAAATTVQGALLRRSVALVRRTANETEPTDGHIFDALRLELARIVTLGLAGFDAPLSGDGAREAAAALRGVADMAAVYGSASDTLRSRLAKAAAYLEANADVEHLDRLTFIVNYANPASRSLDALRRELGVALPAVPRAWSADAATLFDTNAFDARAFAPAYAPPSTPALVALGHDLFVDPVLSGNGTRACASCHDPHRAFTDGKPRRETIAGGSDDGGRNTPTLINVGLQPASFYDQRTTYLEDQVTDVIGNRAEMAHSIDGAAEQLRRRQAYVARFASTFGGPADSAVSALRLRIALAAFMRSLQSTDTRVDRALRGDTAALSMHERRGLTVFMGKAKCGTCHFLPLFNGATPPTFTEAEPEVIGVPTKADTMNVTLDPDPGQYAVDRIELHRNAFKTPTLRDIALTAPYMHNGAYATLEQVVDFYDRGGGAGLGLTIEHQTLPSDRLGLTQREKRELIAFLKALTTTSVPTDRKGENGRHSVN